MLPACIAYILLSNSLLDALKGNISPVFLLGLGAVIAAFSIPFFYHRYKKKRDNKIILSMPAAASFRSR